VRKDGKQLRSQKSSSGAQRGGENVQCRCLLLVKGKKNANVFINVKLCLLLKLNSLPLMHHLQFRIDRYIFQAQAFQTLEFYIKLSPIEPTFKDSTPCSTW
jgi:hypothetical protein